MEGPAIGTVASLNDVRGCLIFSPCLEMHPILYHLLDGRSVMAFLPHTFLSYEGLLLH